LNLRFPAPLFGAQDVHHDEVPGAFFLRSANFGAKWVEVDPTYPVINLLHKLNMIQLRPASQKAQARVALGHDRRVEA
jgi:fatty-acid desaturase